MIFLARCGDSLASPAGIPIGELNSTPLVTRCQPCRPWRPCTRPRPAFPCQRRPLLCPRKTGMRLKRATTTFPRACGHRPAQEPPPSEDVLCASRPVRKGVPSSLEELTSPSLLAKDAGSTDTISLPSDAAHSPPPPPQASAPPLARKVRPTSSSFTRLRCLAHGTRSRPAFHFAQKPGYNVGGYALHGGQSRLGIKAAFPTFIVTVIDRLPPVHRQGNRTLCDGCRERCGRSDAHTGNVPGGVFRSKFRQHTHSITRKNWSGFQVQHGSPFGRDWLHLCTLKPPNLRKRIVLCVGVQPNHKL